MPVWIPKIQALAAPLPRALLSHGDPVLPQPVLPTREFRGSDREREMKLAVAVVRRRRVTRAALLKQQQYPAVPGFHRTATLPEIADSLKPEIGRAHV